ncbi:cyclin-D4-1-like [Carica papaya]|uniref:cyclin-D4-1-like n=1 Tax=Carica papaya TaxID=3649 RepID=UPI000B8CA0E6|nr:cyclin-D4-1-like [Carica papaya]
MSRRLSSPDPSASASSSLYCEEDASDVVSADAWDPRFFSSPLCVEETLSGLIESEFRFMPLPDYVRRCDDRAVDVTARQDSINWILKVHAYYHFRPVTALLSVNYFDRFLSVHPLPKENRWPFQLLSVACLSLAAKMEEPDVPLLLDLQIFEPRFVFEPKAVQRMELWVMENLKWRLRSVTPFDYLHYFISKLPSSSFAPGFFTRVFSASSDLILRTTRVIDFLGFSPSTIATAAVLCATGDVDGKVIVVPDYFHARLNKEMVRSCHQLMEEYMIDTCPSAPLKELRVEPPQPPPAPPSPVGVLDAASCVSCDTRSENPGSSDQAEPPPAKRSRSSDPDVQQ